MLNFTIPMATSVLSIFAISDLYSLSAYSRFQQFLEQQFQYQHAHLATLSGDFFHANPYTPFDQGKTIMNAIQLADIDIVSLGNHEFDMPTHILENAILQGQRQIQTQGKEQQQDKGPVFLSTNVDSIQGTIPWTIYDMPPNNYYNTVLTLGFLGVVSDEFYVKHNVSFLNKSVAVGKALLEMKLSRREQKKREIDYFIVLSHQDPEEDRRLVDAFPEIDIVLAGHIHSRQYEVYKNTHILRSGENAKYVGHVLFYIPLQCTSGQIKKEIQQPLVRPKFIVQMQRIEDKDKRSGREDKKQGDETSGGGRFVELMASAEKMLSMHKDKVMFYLKREYTTLTHRFEESDFMTAFCNLLRRELDGEVSILNAGIFREARQYKEGVFTYADYIAAFTFNDPIVKVNMSGADLQDGVHYANKMYYDDGGFLHLSSLMSFAPSVSAPGPLQVVRDIVRNKWYQVVTSTLILDGIDKNPFFYKYRARNVQEGIPIKNILLEHAGEWI